MEKISLYVPVYNDRQYLKKCLDSVLTQTYPVDEIILIDDGSAGNLGEITSNYPVKVITHKKNKGIAAARNTALKNAKNNLLASLDADTAASPNWLENLIKQIKRKNVAGAGGKLIETNKKGLANKWRDIHMRQSWGDKTLKNPPFLYGNNCLYKKDVLKKMSGYNNKYKTNYEDYAISKKIMESDYQLIYTPSAIAYHYRKDTITTVLAAFWRWIFFHYPQPVTMSYLIKKIIRNFRLSLSFFARDASSANFNLLFLDLFMGFYHSWLDYNFYKTKKK
jgi:glycosyltransferase involved in cell wall biosynthesis